MARQVKDLLAQQVLETFVGREAERAILLHALEGDGPLVVFVHGIGGIGKSSLIDVFALDARAHGATVVRLDCRTIEPSQRGFLRELGAASGFDATTPEAAARRLGCLGERVVLTLDTYEVFRMMDTWLRQVFVPALHDNVRVYFFGREPPVAAWSTSPGWQGLFQSVRLGPLNEQDALELLAISGLDEYEARRVNQFARGHPLALRLAAAAIAERPELRLREIASQHVVEELTRLYLADVPDPLTREALEVASVIRRTTRTLLGVMLPDAAPQDAYERLHALPFVESGSDGLILHEAVQQAIATGLRGADPSRYRAFRRAAWHELRAEVRTAAKEDIWRYTADLLFMIEEPVLREAFFPSGMQPLAVEPARPEDAPAIRAISQRNEGPQGEALLDALWTRLPGSFRAMRDRNRRVVGFYCVFDPATVDRAVLRDDPILCNWWLHLQEEPMPRNQRALFCRRWLDAELGEAPSPGQAACWLDLKGLYMEMRSYLRRVYVTAVDAQVYAPILQKLRFRVLPRAQVKLDGRVYHTAVLDFGPALFNGWLAGLVGAELGVKRDEVLDVEARELVVDDQRVGLTPLEFEVMCYLYEREGKAVSRMALLSDVWGYEYQGGSNVVDSVIHSLRKKLGDQAFIIETVTGVGYRYRQG